MAYRDFFTLSACFTLSLCACGPGTDDVTGTGATGSSGGGSGTGTSTTDVTGTTSVPTSDATTGQTTQTTTGTTEQTTGQTSDGTTGQTSDGTTGGVACPDTLPEEGTACDMEGQFCNSGCEDPCSFCNVVHCEGGVWKNMEVFPANCLDCDSLCEITFAADCPAGPPSKAVCVDACVGNQAGDCKVAFNSILACIGPAPEFICDGDGRPNVAGCEDRFDAFHVCEGE